MIPRSNPLSYPIKCQAPRRLYQHINPFAGGFDREKMSYNHTKTSWPELLGLPGKVAKQKILADRSDVTVDVLPYGSVVTEDYDIHRVRVFVNKAGNVEEVPKIG
ncbi:unnamed protein product [Urochloa humidicola]